MKLLLSLSRAALATLVLVVLLGPALGSVLAQANPAGNQIGFAVLRGRIESLHVDAGQLLRVDVPVNNYWILPVQELNLQVAIRDAAGVVTQNASTTSVPPFSSRTLRVTLTLDGQQASRILKAEAVYVESHLSFFYPEPLLYMTFNSTQRVK